MGRLYEELEDDSGAVLRYRRHANGRGLVAPTARVDDTAYLEASAWVEPEARVGRDCWVGAGSWIDRGARLGDRTFIGANVHVGAGTNVGAGVRVGSHTKIGPNAVIAPGTRVERDIVVPEGARLGRLDPLEGAAADRASRRASGTQAAPERERRAA